MITETSELLSKSTHETLHWNTTQNLNSTMNFNTNMNSTLNKTEQSMDGYTTVEPEYVTSTDINNNTAETTYYPTVGMYEEQTYADYYYPGYSFERPIYLVIWEVMVIATALVNILVIVVLLRKKMRSRTNMILTAIAVSDTLTGVVTLPTYIMAYQKFEPAQSYDLEYDSLYYSNYPGFTIAPPKDAYALSKTLCKWFMLTKFFFSKMFHTMSIFLTLLLAFQRYVSVAYPYIANRLLTKRSTLVTCVLIFIFSPVLHIYHVINEKAKDGMCEWKLENCEGDCAFVWIVLIFRHFIPCALLTVFTFLFVQELRKSNIIGGNREQVERRERENRRATIIVIAIVIVFLIPEIPYGFFLLVSVISKHTNTAFDLEKNRLIHAIYELTLVTSFHANFYIYTFLNSRFRAGLKRTVHYPIQTLLGRPYRWSLSRSQSGRATESQRRTLSLSIHSRNGTLLRQMSPDQVNIALTEEHLLAETKLANGTSMSRDNE